MKDCEAFVQLPLRIRLGGTADAGERHPDGDDRPVVRVVHGQGSEQWYRVFGESRVERWRGVCREGGKAEDGSENDLLGDGVGETKKKQRGMCCTSTRDWGILCSNEKACRRCVTTYSTACNS